MATIKEMAQAHLLNVQQQINDLEAQKTRIDDDIKALGEYLQQGAVELEVENDVDSVEAESDE
jgi:hypothetical protein